MGKKKMINQCLIAIFCIFNYTQLNSQIVLTETLIWEEKIECVNKLYNYMKDSKDINVKKIIDSNFVVKDSIAIELHFKNKYDILEWFNAGGYIKSEEFTVNDKNLFVISEDWCSGIYCPSIFIFKKEKDVWTLIAHSRANISEQLIISADYERGKLLFKTATKTLGEYCVSNSN